MDFGTARYPTMLFTSASRSSSNDRKRVHQSIDVRECTPEVHCGSSPLIWLFVRSPQADLNSSGMQDGPGSFYGVSSQYSSHENMTITVSTKVCSFGKQVVEKVEVRTAESAFAPHKCALSLKASLWIVCVSCRQSMPAWKEENAFIGSTALPCANTWSTLSTNSSICLKNTWWIAFLKTSRFCRWICIVFPSLYLLERYATFVKWYDCYSCYRNSVQISLSH